MAASKDAVFTLASNSGAGTPLSAASATAFQAGAGSFSVGAFVKLASTPAQIQAVISKWDNTSPGAEYLLRWGNGTSKFEFLTDDGTTAYVVSGGTTPSVGTWYFVYAYFDRTAGQIGIYVNAASDATPVTAAVQNAAAAFRLGSDSASTGSDFPLDGQVAMVFKYSSLLTGPQLTWLYNGGFGRSPAEILAHTGLTTPDFLYGFENSGALGTDSGPNALTLTKPLTVGPTQGTGPGPGGPTTATVTGPSTLTVGTPGTYTITLPASDVGASDFTPTASGFSATFSPTLATIANGTTTITFSATATSAGSGTISATSPGFTVTGQSVTSSSAPPAPTTLTVTGSGTGVDGTPLTLTATLDHPAGSGGITYTPTASVVTAVFSPNPVVFNAGDTVKTFTITASTAGTSSVGGSAS